MKQKRSMDDAINAAKRLRQEMSESREGDASAGEVRLKVVEAERHVRSVAASDELRVSDPPTSQITVAQPVGRATWVRHTIGLRSTTSLQLRDAAEAQKKKARYGVLGPDEPSNEQEIADFGIRLAIRELERGN